jgi:hypothetical protein
MRRTSIGHEYNVDRAAFEAFEGDQSATTKCFVVGVGREDQNRACRADAVVDRAQAKQKLQKMMERDAGNSFYRPVTANAQGG